MVVAVGVGDLLEDADDPKVDVGGAGFGIVPEVKAVGEEGTVLGIDDEED